MSFSRKEMMVVQNRVRAEEVVERAEEVVSSGYVLKVELIAFPQVGE